MSVVRTLQPHTSQRKRRAPIVYHGPMRVALVSDAVALLALCLAVAGCGFIGKQLAINSSDRCIEDHCKGEQGKARQRCTTACMRRYGP